MIKFRYTREFINLNGLLVFILALMPSAWAKAPSLNLDANIHADVGTYSSNEDFSTIKSSKLRRLRISAKGNLGTQWNYKAGIDTNSSGDSQFTDLYLRWKSPNFSFILGQHKPPISLDEQISSNDISTQERAAFTDLIKLDRNMGVTLQYHAGGFSGALGVFSQNIENNTDGANILAARAGYKNTFHTNNYLYLGAYARQREHTDNGPGFRYRQRAFTRLNSYVLETDYIAESEKLIGIETAFGSDTYWMVGEYAQMIISCKQTYSCNSNDVNFDGGYAEIGMMVSGKRPFKLNKFGKPIADGNSDNPLMLVLRYDYLDLSDDNVLKGGNYKAVIAAANWWVNPNMTLRGNLFWVEGQQNIHLLTDNLAQLSIPYTRLKDDSIGLAFRMQFIFDTKVF